MESHRTGNTNGRTVLHNHPKYSSLMKVEGPAVKDGDAEKLIADIENSYKDVFEILKENAGDSSFEELRLEFTKSLQKSILDQNGKPITANFPRKSLPVNLSQNPIVKASKQKMKAVHLESMFQSALLSILRTRIVASVDSGDLVARMFWWQSSDSVRKCYTTHPGFDMFCLRFNKLSEDNQDEVRSIANMVRLAMRVLGTAGDKARILDIACRCSPRGRRLTFGGNMWTCRNHASDAWKAVCLEMIFEMEMGKPRKDKPFWEVRCIDHDSGSIREIGGARATGAPATVPETAAAAAPPAAANEGKVRTVIKSEPAEFMSQLSSQEDEVFVTGDGSEDALGGADLGDAFGDSGSCLSRSLCLSAAPCGGMPHQQQHVHSRCKGPTVPVKIEKVEVEQGAALLMLNAGALDKKIKQLKEEKTQLEQQLLILEQRLQDLSSRVVLMTPAPTPAASGSAVRPRNEAFDETAEPARKRATLEASAPTCASVSVSDDLEIMDNAEDTVPMPPPNTLHASSTECSFSLLSSQPN